MNNEVKRLEVTPVSSYGKREFRPECAASRLFVELLGQKHLTERNVETIKKLGYEVRLKGGVL